MTHALIIGGGVAGAATAMALHKAGISATVYEAYPSGGEDIGAFLMIMPNGMNALRAIDAHGPVVAASFRTDHVEYLDAAGKVFTARQIHDSDPDGPRTLTRAALYHALQGELLARGGRIEHGKRLTTATTTPYGRVLASFADGTRAEGDLLIGADGMRSVTRTLIDPQAPAPRYTGEAVVYGYTEVADIPQAHNTFRMIHGTRTSFGYTTSTEGVTFWVAHVPGPERSRAELAATPWRERALELLRDDPDPAAARIVAAPGADPLGAGVFDIASLPRWYRGSMVLVGDAAHAAGPQAAQGASMALEDSVVLAQCLRDLPGPAEAFTTFERIRRARVERLVAQSAERAATLDEAEQMSRPEQRSWLYEHRLDWDTPITSTVG
ncbi:FAD-dependent monooxygenase [Nocardia sp. NPDC051570]|uniref:FAD-dependent monooxygenase n=1 Tax=Nocardia sp. NPDC051570 TaxID=3364324 RepID=UPI0037903133